MHETEDPVKHRGMNLSSQELSTHRPRRRSEKEGCLRSITHAPPHITLNDSAPPTAPNRSDAGVRTEVLGTVLQANCMAVPDSSEAVCVCAWIKAVLISHFPPRPLYFLFYSDNNLHSLLSKNILASLCPSTLFIISNDIFPVSRY